MGKKVIIIGGGVAGMQTAITLSKLGISPVIIEREETIGGKLNRWDRLFPTMTPASEVLGSLREQVPASLRRGGRHFGFRPFPGRTERGVRL